MICYVALLVFPFQILVWLLFNLRLFFRRLTSHASPSEALIDTLGCPAKKVPNFLGLAKMMSIGKKPAAHSIYLITGPHLSKLASTPPLLPPHPSFQPG